MNKIVTRQSLQDMLDNENPAYVNHVIGRALVGIFNRQTEEEKRIDHTREDNGIGFTGADSYSGSLTAKYFLKHKTLQDWQRERWLKRAKNGYSRLTKYWKQLNEIANEKAGTV